MCQFFKHPIVFMRILKDIIHKNVGEVKDLIYAASSLPTQLK